MSASRPLNGSVGQHVLLDCRACAAHLLADTPALETHLRQAAALAGAQVLQAHFHPFGEGLGVTGVLLLAESHISIHTWPEYAYAAIDVFMCGQVKVDLATAYLTEVFGGNCEKTVIRRGA